MVYLNRLFEFLILFLPISLIIGHAFVNVSIVLICLFFLIYIFIKKEYYLFNKKLFIFFNLWALYLIIISAFSQFPKLSFEASLFYFRFGIFVLAIYFLCTFKHNFSKNFLYVLIACYFVLTFDGLLQFITGKNISGLEKINNRVSSFFGTELILGSYIARLLPLLLALLLYKSIKENYAKILFILLIVSSSLLIFISGERTAFFVFILSILIILTLISNLNKTRIITASILITTSLLSIIYFDVASTRMIHRTIAQINLFDKGKEITGQKNIDSISLFSIQHQAIYTTAFKIFKDYPVFGIGPKNFRKKCSELNPSLGRDWPLYKTKSKFDISIDGCQTSPHNIYIQLLVETGVVGTIPVLILFLFVLYKIIQSYYYKYIKGTQIITNFQICLYVAIFVNLWPIIPSGNFFNSYISVIYYFPIGFLIYSYKINKDI